MFDILRPPSSPFEQPSLPHRIVSSPVRFLAQQLYSFQLFLRRRTGIDVSDHRRLRVLCISDTHSLRPSSLPAADILVHAGDLTNDGTADDVKKELDWLGNLDYKYKIVIAGNHDSYFDPRSRRKEDNGLEIMTNDKKKGLFYLQHGSLTLEFPEHSRELTIYGAPQIPFIREGFAFQYPRHQDAWTDTIPDDVDILITHTPPQHHLDLPRGMGCEYLLQEIWRKQPLLHIFGHIHHGYGQQEVHWDRAQSIFERLCNRKRAGLLWDAIDVFAWTDLVRLVLRGTLAFIWKRVWGGNDNPTLLVNAALMLESTGRLENKPQVVVI